MPELRSILNKRKKGKPMTTEKQDLREKASMMSESERHYAHAQR